MKDEELKTEAEKTNEENEDHGGRTVGTDDERGELRSFLQCISPYYPIHIHTTMWLLETVHAVINRQTTKTEPSSG